MHISLQIMLDRGVLLCYSVFTCRQRGLILLCPFGPQGGNRPVEAGQIKKEVPQNASQGHTQVQRVQAAQLQYGKEQEEHP
jgi:hypothetical protein